MKTRNGFVSNSSSSSFVVLRRDPTLSEEEMVNRTVKHYRKEWGKDYDKEPGLKDELEEQAHRLADKGQYIFLKDRVEYGGEESVERIVRSILKLFDIDDKDLEMKWEE